MKNPNANVVLVTIINKANVPADLRSAGIKYKDLWSFCFSVVRVVKGAFSKWKVKSEKSKCFEDFCRKHYVAIVPADLQSAGRYYLDFQSA